MTQRQKSWIKEKLDELVDCVIKYYLSFFYVNVNKVLSLIHLILLND